MKLEAKVRLQAKKDEDLQELIEQYPDYKKIAKKLSEKTGVSLKGEDYIDWMEASGHGDGIKFEKAVIKFVGKKAFDKAQTKALVPQLLDWKLGMGDKVVNNCDFSKL